MEASLRGALPSKESLLASALREFSRAVVPSETYVSNTTLEELKVGGYIKERLVDYLFLYASHYWYKKEMEAQRRRGGK